MTELVRKSYRNQLYQYSRLTQGEEQGAQVQKVARWSPLESGELFETRVPKLRQPNGQSFRSDWALVLLARHLAYVFWCLYVTIYSSKHAIERYHFIFWGRSVTVVTQSVKSDLAALAHSFDALPSNKIKQSLNSTNLIWGTIWDRRFSTLVHNYHNVPRCRPPVFHRLIPQLFVSACPNFRIYSPVLNG